MKKYRTHSRKLTLSDLKDLLVASGYSKENPMSAMMRHVFGINLPVIGTVAVRPDSRFRYAGKTLQAIGISKPNLTSTVEVIVSLQGTDMEEMGSTTIPMRDVEWADLIELTLTESRTDPQCACFTAMRELNDRQRTDRPPYIAYKKTA